MKKKKLPNKLTRQVSSKASWMRAVSAVLFCEIIGILSALVVTPSQSPWYQQLSKPVFQPPSWIFGPIWTILYFLMGMALYRGWLKGAKLKWFYIQLALNVLWSYLFFGLHEIGLAFLEIIVLFCAILVTMSVFGKKDKLAVKLLLPYLAWVGFATILNIAIWMKN